MQRRINESENDWIEELGHNEESLSQLENIQMFFMVIEFIHSNGSGTLEANLY